MFWLTLLQIVSERWWFPQEVIFWLFDADFLLTLLSFYLFFAKKYFARLCKRHDWGTWTLLSLWNEIIWKRKDFIIIWKGNIKLLLPRFVKHYEAEFYVGATGKGRTHENLVWLRITFIKNVKYSIVLCGEWDLWALLLVSVFHTLLRLIDLPL